MYNINQVTEGEYHAADSSRTPENFKWTLFVTSLRVYVLMVVEGLQFVFILLFGARPKRESIKNQLALVTGGGNGLGRAICFRLAQEQCDLAIVDIDYGNAQKTAEEIMSQHEVTCKAYQCDISDIDAIEKLKTDVESDMRGVDILVNNAGLLYASNFVTSKADDIKRVVDVNLTAHIVMTRTFLSGMIERKRGKIVSICSMASFLPVPLLNVYSATKWGLNGFMQGLANELLMTDRDLHIKLTCVYPEFMNTRKEAMDLLDKMNFLMPKLRPERVADETVRGMLQGKSKVYVSNVPVLNFFVINYLPKRVKKYLLSTIFNFDELYRSESELISI